MCHDLPEEAADVELLYQLPHSAVQSFGDLVCNQSL
jgi:hypothetical protein